MVVLTTLLLTAVLLAKQVTSLKCHHCVEVNDSGDCSNAALVECTDEQDMCRTVVSWPDNGSSEMTLVKSCSNSSECRESDETGTPTCYPSAQGWVCVYCCRDNICNQGGVGRVVRPPPIPPVPEPLVQRLAGDCGRNSRFCATSITWSDAENFVSINKFCSQPETEDYAVAETSTLCDEEENPDFCVSCCISEMNTCFSNINSANVVTLNSLAYILTCTLIYLLRV
ncbi:uncharacterized protein [Ptychodera flava]|uniref:uncharacterized protein isoform X2 n=1 Tax=Ptychodera flava TaxID=63121 RepID=UPI00396AAB9E